MSQSSLFDTIITAAPPADWRPDALPGGQLPDTLGFDTETTGLKWWAGDRPIGFSLAWPGGSGYYPWGHAGGNLPEDRVKEWCRANLRDKRLVGLNVRFDAHTFREWGVDLEAQGCTLHDVGHSAALLDDHRQSFSLENIAQDVLGEGKTQDGLDKSRMAEYHAFNVTAYARRDAELVLRLDEAQRGAIAEQGLAAVEALEDEVIFAVLAMEAAGTPLDVERLHRWRREAKKDEERLAMEVYAAAGFWVNPDSPKEMVRLFDSLGLKPGTTETGRPSFTDDVLKPLAETNETVAAVRRLGQAQSFRSKFLDPYADSVQDDGRMRYALHQLRGERGGTVSGRFSSSAPAGRGSGINVQQVMSVENQVKNLGPGHIIRELFVPASGLFLAADADQIEYRLFAHYANSPTLNAAYATDPRADFHQVVCDMIDQADIPRKQAKNVNFARLYGAGKGKVGTMLGLGARETEEFLKVYDKAFPEVKALARQATTTAENRGWVKTLLGRRSRFPGGERSHKALNAIIQGTAADIMKLKLVELYRATRDTGLVLRYTVHDEVCGDVPDEEAARKVNDILNRQSLELRVPIFWSTLTGKNWAECK